MRLPYFYFVSPPNPCFAFRALLPLVSHLTHTPPSLLLSTHEYTALFTRARSDRELRDGPAHHLTLLHRNEIQVEGEKGEGGGKEGGREDEADGCNKDEAAAAAAASATPTSAASPSASSPCAAEEQQTEDENEPPSLAPTLHGSLSTMPEDRDDDEAQEQGGGKGGIQDESQQTSAPAVPPPPSFSSWTRHRHQHHQDDDEEVEAVAAALLATLTTPLSTYLLPHLPPLLHDPLPLYIYRTSGEGRALAVSVLFLPGEWLRHWHGQVRRGGGIDGGRVGKTKEVDLDMK